jgi:hypothetical protein
MKEAKAPFRCRRHSALGVDGLSNANRRIMPPGRGTPGLETRLPAGEVALDDAGARAERRR